MKLKPHLLVNVAERNTLIADPHHYVGEVMSFVTPDKTVMVRRVPGCTGTLVELPVGCVSPSDWRRVIVTYAECAGSGSFPVDMLRYDNAVPVNFKLVPHEWKGVEIELEAGYDSLVIAKASLSHYEPFTLARWGSFLWGVKILRTEQIAI